MNQISTTRGQNGAAITLDNVYPVVLCGGAGKRLWPMSRQACPKQFQPLCSQDSMLQQTVSRLDGDLRLQPPLILCSDEHRFLVAEQLAEIDKPPLAAICEPASRNTAPALTAAALMLHEQDADSIMLAMPADHMIGDLTAFQDAVVRAADAAAEGWLVTFGIAPSRPETGYGYIRTGEALGDRNDVFRVSRFIEKPERTAAERLVADGGYLWNSGIFMLPTKVFLDEVRRHAPEMEAACGHALDRGERRSEGLLLDEAAFTDAPDISIDYAIMERTERAAVVRAEMAWSDVGSWHALRDVGDPDADGNVVHGNVVIEDVTNSFIHANGRLVTAVGLDNVVVVDTEDALLVTDAAHTGAIDGLVRRLRAIGTPEASEHARVRRPWGSYQTVDRGERFQVKHIMVKPGEQLSLQMHHHRAEHWIVVSGTGTVTCGEEVRLLHENETVHIPVGTTHRLENPGKIPLHLIEVQVGPYLGEDDIVRFNDVYGRA